MSTLADRVPRADGANGFQLQYYGAQARDASWNMRLKTSTYGAPLSKVMGNLKFKMHMMVSNSEIDGKYVLTYALLKGVLS